MPLSGKPVSGPQGETLAWHGEEHPIELTGFVLPIDQDGDLVYEFMLVPWAGACSHMPSPPPNQLVRVVPQAPLHLTRMYETVTVTGALQPGLDEAQFFMIDGNRVLTYGYSMTVLSLPQVPTAETVGLHRRMVGIGSAQGCLDRVAFPP